MAGEGGWQPNWAAGEKGFSGKQVEEAQAGQLSPVPELPWSTPESQASSTQAPSPAR